MKKESEESISLFSWILGVILCATCVFVFILCMQPTIEYTEGYDSYLQGQPCELNPYPVDSEEFHNWHNGWTSSKQQKDNSDE